MPSTQIRTRRLYRLQPQTVLSYSCYSFAMAARTDGYWPLQDYTAKTPSQALTWLLDHIESIALNAEPEAASTAQWWCDNPLAGPRTERRLSQGQPLSLRFKAPGLTYHIRISPRCQQRLVEWRYAG